MSENLKAHCIFIKLDGSTVEGEFETTRDGHYIIYEGKMYYVIECRPKNPAYYRIDNVFPLGADEVREFLKSKDIFRKACKVIEVLVSDDFCEDLESLVQFDNISKLKPEDIKIIANKIMKIYEFTHSINGHSCEKVHEDWREKLEETYKQMEAEGFFKCVEKNDG